jgi:hypothetical protein
MDLKNSYCTFDCQKGFQFATERETTNPFVICLPSKLGPTWSSKAPQCTDINECALAINPCQENLVSGKTHCKNTVGSYTCTCKPGFSEFTNGCKESLAFEGTIRMKEKAFTMELMNSQTEEYKSLEKQVVSTLRELYSKILPHGTYFKIILQEFSHGSIIAKYQVVQEKTVPVDLAEVQSSLSKEISAQNGTAQGFSVARRDVVIQDVDECQSGLHDCDEEVSMCKNSDGSFACICKEGYDTVISTDGAIVGCELANAFPLTIVVGILVILVLAVISIAVFLHHKAKGKKVAPIYTVNEKENSEVDGRPISPVQIS